MNITKPTFTITGADAPVDMVNRPPHYQSESESGIECIEAIEAALSPEEFRGYLKGNALKYIWREGKKGNRAQDINKAVWYMGRMGKTL
ncbi:TPA: DUF3310 domain-containing protein [Klebsiella aerogenes]|nr:DUF3310 domain-containing protein [Klebsiella aerogenes]